MTIKQQKFCDELLICNNKTQAALNAGYSKSTAMGAAQGWVGNYRNQSAYPEMWDYVEKKRAEIENEYRVSRGIVLKGFHRIADVDLRKMFDDFGDPIPLHELDEATAAAISGYDVSRTLSKEGVVTKIIKVRFADRNSAWSSIAKMLGYNAPEKVEHGAGETFLDFLKKSTAGIEK